MALPTFIYLWGSSGGIETRLRAWRLMDRSSIPGKVRFSTETRAHPASCAVSQEVKLTPHLHSSFFSVGCLTTLLVSKSYSVRWLNLKKLVLSENWQGKPKYTEKTCLSSTSSTTNPTWRDLRSSPGRRGGKPAPLSSAEVKNTWTYTSTSPYVFMTWCTEMLPFTYLQAYSTRTGTQ
jgi:hypothetical protein